jgi:GNAT superfamily N-acetyltransferase
MPSPEFEISTDFARVDLDLVHRFLSASYWAKGRSREVVERSLRNSLCFSAFEGSQQVAFGRVITDRAVFAYIADVFVIAERRGLGIGRRSYAPCLRIQTYASCRSSCCARVMRAHCMLSSDFNRCLDLRR